MTVSPSGNGPRQLQLDLGREPSYAREDFIISASNEAAVAALDTWPRWPGGKLALIGPRGAGKTHLARAWAAKVGAVTFGAIAGDVRLAEGGAILLDDADRDIGDDRLFHLDNMTNAGVSLLITGRTLPATWPVVLADLESRLRAITVARLEPPDDFVLLNVMEKLFSERNIRPGAGVSSYALRRIERSVPAVQDLVRQIDECAGAERREVTLALVRRILQTPPQTFE